MNYESNLNNLIRELNVPDCHVEAAPLFRQDIQKLAAVAPEHHRALFARLMEIFDPVGKTLTKATVQSIKKGKRKVRVLALPHDELTTITKQLLAPAPAPAKKPAPVKAKSADDLILEFANTTASSGPVRTNLISYLRRISRELNKPLAKVTQADLVDYLRAVESIYTKRSLLSAAKGYYAWTGRKDDPTANVHAARPGEIYV